MLVFCAKNTAYAKQIYTTKNRATPSRIAKRSEKQLVLLSGERVMFNAYNAKVAGRWPMIDFV